MLYNFKKTIIKSAARKLRLGVTFGSATLRPNRSALDARFPFTWIILTISFCNGFSSKISIWSSKTSSNCFSSDKASSMLYNKNGIWPRTIVVPFRLKEQGRKWIFPLLHNLTEQMPPKICAVTFWEVIVYTFSIQSLPTV